MNVLCLGSEVIGAELAAELVRAFLRARVRRRRAVRAAAGEDRTKWKGRMHMAKSRLHELTEHGQSVWIDSLSREWLADGTLERLMERGRRRRRHLEPDDLPEGARRGRLVRRPAPRAARAARTTRSEIFFALAVARRQGGVRPAAPGLGRRATGRTATSRSRSTPTSRTTREATFEQAHAPARVGRPAEPLREDPGDRARAAARSRSRSPRGKSINVTLIFSLAALRGRRRGLHPRARAARRVGRRPGDGRVGRVVLRLARRHRGRQAAGGDRHRRRSTLRASSRSRTRSSRTSTTRRSSRASAGSALAAQGRDAAALPLGVDVDEEPRVPRRPLRRGADRAATP